MWNAIDGVCFFGKEEIYFGYIAAIEIENIDFLKTNTNEISQFAGKYFTNSKTWDLYSERVSMYIKNELKRSC